MAFHKNSKMVFSSAGSTRAPILVAAIVVVLQLTALMSTSSSTGFNLFAAAVQVQAAKGSSSTSTRTQDARLVGQCVVYASEIQEWCHNAQVDSLDKVLGDMTSSSNPGAAPAPASVQQKITWVKDFLGQFSEHLTVKVKEVFEVGTTAVEGEKHGQERVYFLETWQEFRSYVEAEFGIKKRKSFRGTFGDYKRMWAKFAELLMPFVLDVNLAFGLHRVVSAAHKCLEPRTIFVDKECKEVLHLKENRDHDWADSQFTDRDLLDNYVREAEAKKREVEVELFQELVRQVRKRQLAMAVEASAARPAVVQLPEGGLTTGVDDPTISTSPDDDELSDSDSSGGENTKHSEERIKQATKNRIDDEKKKLANAEEREMLEKMLEEGREEAEMFLKEQKEKGLTRNFLEEARHQDQQKAKRKLFKSKLDKALVQRIAEAILQGRHRRPQAWRRVEADIRRLETRLEKAQSDDDIVVGVLNDLSHTMKKNLIRICGQEEADVAPSPRGAPVSSTTPCVPTLWKNEFAERLQQHNCPAVGFEYDNRNRLQSLKFVFRPNWQEEVERGQLKIFYRERQQDRITLDEAVEVSIDDALWTFLESSAFGDAPDERFDKFNDCLAHTYRGARVSYLGSLQLLDLTLTSQRHNLSELLGTRTSLGNRLREAVLSSPSYKRAMEVQAQWIRFLTEWEVVWRQEVWTWHFQVMKDFVGLEADEPNYQMLDTLKRESNLRAAVFKAWESVSFAVRVAHLREDKPDACLVGLAGSTKAAPPAVSCGLPVSRRLPGGISGANEHPRKKLEAIMTNEILVFEHLDPIKSIEEMVSEGKVGATMLSSERLLLLSFDIPKAAAPSAKCSASSDDKHLPSPDGAIGKHDSPEGREAFSSGLQLGALLEDEQKNDEARAKATGVNFTVDYQIDSPAFMANLLDFLLLNLGFSKEVGKKKSPSPRSVPKAEWEKLKKQLLDDLTDAQVKEKLEEHDEKRVLHRRIMMDILFQEPGADALEFLKNRTKQFDKGVPKHKKPLAAFVGGGGQGTIPEASVKEGSGRAGQDVDDLKKKSPSGQGRRRGGAARSPSASRRKSRSPSPHSRKSRSPSPHIVRTVGKNKRGKKPSSKKK
ncbi:unnamed protein product [Amoebophrya sp. A120]|nr:unnamed protein product [Amoebophrya sp. A120]|eukprot:GSA120T00013862001.1